MYVDLHFFLYVCIHYCLFIQMLQLHMYEYIVTPENFLQGGYLSFGREGVDLACRDEQGYSFHKDFKIEIFLQRVADPDQVRATALNTVTDSDLIGQGDADLSAADFLHSFGDTNIDESDEDGDGDGDDSRR